MPLWKFENFSGGVVKDVGNGKQPDNSCADIQNLVFDREYGSLVVRYGFENSLDKPSGVSTLSAWVTKPVTYPETKDMHVWFTEDGIFQRPHWKASATSTDAWIKITDNVALTGLIANNPTVTGSTTNTIAFVSTDTCTALGLNATADYYNGWQIQFSPAGGGTSSYWVVKDYAVTSDLATFTLDNVIDANTGSTVTGANFKGGEVLALTRFFHYDNQFTPAFTDPAGYSDERAIRWSGGGGSTAGYKNIKSGYINKIFFGGISPSFTYQGTYIDQAECVAPASTLASVTYSDANANIISAAKNYEFNDTTSNWANNGTHVGVLGAKLITQNNGFPPTNPKYREWTINATGLIINATGSTTLTSDYVYLADTYVGSMTHDVEYTLKFKAVSLGLSNVARDAKIRFGLYANSTLYQSVDVVVGSNAEEQVVKFTIATTSDAPEIRVGMLAVGDGYADSFALISLSLTTTTTSALALPDGFTYKLFGSYVFDSTQESELTYFGSTFFSTKTSKLSYTLSQRLGTLNKFVTGIRLYVSQEIGNTTSKGATVFEPKYLIADIPIDNSATATWSFTTGTGVYTYLGGMNGDDWNNRGFTWEQKTGRTDSDSITCSYSIAEKASGRTFLSNEYDYADARSYTNRVRYNGFNGDGIPTPDIFPNIQDVFITTVDLGQSNAIKNLKEFDGDLRIIKQSSYLNLTTSNPNSFLWQLQLIGDGIGTFSKFGAVKTDRGLVWSDKNSIYIENGSPPRDLLKGIWKYYYKSLVTSDTIAASQRMWFEPIDRTINLAYDTATSTSTAQKLAKMSLEDLRPVFHTVDGFNNVVQTSDGKIHFCVTDLTALTYANKFYNGYTASQVDVSFDTGYRDVEIDKRIVVDELFLILESGQSSPIIVTLYGDGSSIQATTITPSATGKRVYRIPVAQHSPVKATKITVSQVGTVNINTAQFKAHKLAFSYNLKEEYGDVTYYT